MRRRASAFTLIELMIVVAIMGIAAAIAVPAFMKYVRRSKTVEASINIRRIYDSTVTYYVTERGDHGGQVVPRVFPPAMIYCESLCSSFTGNKCPPWRCGDTVPRECCASWQSINFSIDDPHYFNYQTYGQGTGSAIGDIYQIEGRGDLNNDSVPSLFRRSATVDGAYTISAGSGLYIINELD